MSMADVFDRLAAALFSTKAADPNDDIEPDVLAEAVEAIVEVVEPRIRLVPRYQRRLNPVATRMIRFMRMLSRELQTPIELSRDAWNSQPAINAFFAKADDVSLLFTRSAELHDFFADPVNAAADAAYCVLGMRREERRVFASAIVDDQLRSDVAQTTVGFVEHRLFGAASEPLLTRRRVGKTILERVAALPLQNIVTAREQATELDTRASVLATRLRMLELRRRSRRELAPGEPDPAPEIAAIEMQLESMVKDRREAKASLATLDYSIEQIEEVLGNPERYVGLETVAMRVTHTGYKLDSHSDAPGSDLRFGELFISPALRVVIVPVFVPRRAHDAATSIAGR